MRNWILLAMFIIAAGAITGDAGSFTAVPAPTLILAQAATLGPPVGIPTLVQPENLSVLVTSTLALPESLSTPATITPLVRPENLSTSVTSTLAQPTIVSTPLGTEQAAGVLLSCKGFTFNPNPIASSNEPQIIEQPSLIGNQEDEEVLTVEPLDEGILENQWVSLVSDKGAPYLNGATCESLKFGWQQDYRFSFVTTYASLERAIHWLSSNGLGDSLPRALEVLVSETQPASRYDTANRELIIGSRQCSEKVNCGCSQFTPCPESSDDRPIWPHAQDADIVLHEYGHAVLHHLVCGDKVGCVLPTGQIVTALDEGFADYLASAVNQSTSNQKNDPFCFGEWYNSFQMYLGPCLRRLDSDLHWPETARALREELPYSYSSIWASTLFKARQAVPKETMDRIVFEAYAGLEQDMSFEQMAARIVDASSRIDGGQYAPTIRSFLRQQGFLNDLAPPAATSGNMLNRKVAVQLSSRELSAFPAFDHQEEITVSGALAIQLHFDRVRLKDGDCFEAPCGRLYVGDANGQIYEVIEGVYDNYMSVIVPGETVVLRFVASFDHPRTTVYRVTDFNVWSAE